MSSYVGHYLLFLFIVTLTFESCFTQISNLEGKHLTGYACEGKMLRISCDSSQEIKIIRANFGRFSISLCNFNANLLWSVSCKSEGSLEKIERYCQHKSICEVPASTEIFGDPCPETHKYLEINYHCVPRSGMQDDIVYMPQRPSLRRNDGYGILTSRSPPPIIIPTVHSPVYTAPSSQPSPKTSTLAPLNYVSNNDLTSSTISSSSSETNTIPSSSESYYSEEPEMMSTASSSSLFSSPPTLPLTTLSSYGYSTIDGNLNNVEVIEMDYSVLWFCFVLLIISIIVAMIVSAFIVQRLTGGKSHDFSTNCFNTSSSTNSSANYRPDSTGYVTNGGLQTNNGNIPPACGTWYPHSIDHIYECIV